MEKDWGTATVWGQLDTMYGPGLDPGPAKNIRETVQFEKSSVV